MESVIDQYTDENKNESLGYICVPNLIIKFYWRPYAH